MKKTLRCLLSFVCIACLSTMSFTAHAANKKTNKVTNKVTATHASKSKKPVARSNRSRGKPVVTSNVIIEQTCKTVRVRTKKGYRTQKKCTNSNSALQSPIGAGDLNAQPGSNKQAELKARTSPDRAYAVDGYTFFHQGRKYRVIGINEALIPAGSDLAKQRLQLALDSGAISVEPETVDESGTMRALVRVGGKNLADVLNASR